MISKGVWSEIRRFDKQKRSTKMSFLRFFFIFVRFLSKKLCKGKTFAESATNSIKYNILCKNNDYCIRYNLRKKVKSPKTSLAKGSRAIPANMNWKSINFLLHERTPSYLSKTALFMNEMKTILQSIIKSAIWAKSTFCSAVYYYHCYYYIYFYTTFNCYYFRFYYI